MHQPLAGVDEHGHAIPLEYQGASVPRKMNQLGLGGAPVPGSLLTPDPPEETAALAKHAEGARRARGGQHGSNHEAGEARTAGSALESRPTEIAD